jgi:signal transduction histidine kinase
MDRRDDEDRGDCRLRKLIEALDHAVVWELDVTRDEHTFVSSHSLLVLGVECDRWMAEPRLLELITVAEDRPKLEELLQRLRAGEGNDLRLEHRCVRSDGRTVWLHTGIHRDDEGGTRFLRGVTIDITNVKEAEERERFARERAEQAARAQDDLIELVSHDLRNPLSTITLACSAKPADLAAASKTLEMIERAARRMDRLVDDLVDVGRIERQTLAVEPTEASAQGLVLQAVDEFQGHADKAGVTLRADIRGDAVVRCDARRIGQVLSNMLNNAIKFTPSGGSVTARLDVGALEARVTVEDTGSGIPPELLPLLFQRRVQAPTTAHLGSGLGAGRLDVASEPGKGTRVAFTLPLP